MSNKRNGRRAGQRVRSEVDRTPNKITKAMVAFIAAQPSERKRKESERYWKQPTKSERRERELRLRRLRNKPSRRRRGSKPGQASSRLRPHVVESQP